MLFFRSEESLKQWLESKQLKRAAVFSLPQIWDLSQRWYHNRMSPDYRGRTADQVQEIFEEAGLTSEFWKAT
jgi:hypothetical protein